MSIVGCGKQRVGTGSLLSPTLSQPPLPHTPTFKCLLNSIVSDHAFFGSIDLTDFYLGTDNPFPQFLKIYLELMLTLTLSSHVFDLTRLSNSTDTASVLSSSGWTKPCTV
jgi:hypothetical protein